MYIELYRHGVIKNYRQGKGTLSSMQEIYKCTSCTCGMFMKLQHSAECMSLEVPPPPNDSTNASRDDMKNTRNKMSAPAFLNEPSYKEEIWQIVRSFRSQYVLIFGVKVCWSHFYVYNVQQNPWRTWKTWDSSYLDAILRKNYTNLSNIFYLISGHNSNCQIEFVAKDKCNRMQNIWVSEKVFYLPSPLLACWNTSTMADVPKLFTRFQNFQQLQQLAQGTEY